MLYWVLHKSGSKVILSLYQQNPELLWVMHPVGLKAILDPAKQISRGKKIKLEIS
jgi:hypothetical protein